MSAIEIVIIVLAVLFVAAMITITLVRKAKGKAPICSDCSGCPYAKDCKDGKTSQLDACTCKNTKLENESIGSSKKEDEN